VKIQGSRQSGGDINYFNAFAMFLKNFLGRMTKKLKRIPSVMGDEEFFK